MNRRLTPLAAALLAAFAAPVAMQQTASAQTIQIAQDSSTAPIDAALPEVTVKSVKDKSDYNPGTSTVGGKVATPIRDIPQSVNVINRAVLEAQGAASLQEALRNVPGITIGGAEGGQIGNNFNLRGFSARTDMYVDGSRDRGQYYRDTYYLESVEVLKGPSSMLFGRGSTGGVINQVSKAPFLANANQVSLSADTNGGVRSTGDFNRQLSDTSAFRIEMMGQEAKTNRDQMRNTDFGVAPSLRFGIGTPTEVTLSALISHNNDMPDYGLPPLNHQAAPVNRNTFYGLNDDRTIQDVAIVSARVEHKINANITLRNQTQYSDYTTNARETAANNVGTMNNGKFTVLPTGAAGNTTTVPLDQLYVKLASHDRNIHDQSLDNQTDLIARFDTGSIKHTLIVGTEISHDEYDNAGYTRNNLPIVALVNPVYQSQPANVTTTTGNRVKSSANALAAYINDTVALNKEWKLVGGLRWDRYQAELNNSIASGTPALTRADQTVNFTSVRAGVIYQPTDAQSYYASYGTSFNPSLEQLTVTSGQQAIAPETNKSYEVGAKWDLFNGDLSLTSAIFDIEKTNARSLITTGVYQLDGDVRVTGFEFGATGHITPQWQVIGGYTHLNPTVVHASAADGTQGKTLANTPRDNMTLWTTYNLSKQWEVGGGMLYMSSRFASNTNVVSAGGYTRWDATVAFHQPKYDLRLNVLNLFDKHYIDALIPSDGGRSVPGIGVTLLASVNYRF
ncbi:TonB-dependent receptor [Glaciimonas immobilis]|uniref:Catecholate siderophore receptor n=1 Tax=Glaciimonas immobilis TaxID=728004 RepID=A0A840RUY5_9BURK|nr:TonB-dependent siderophore receptor [Glaciimonas immobilis]KAF3999906.1 TonB-dependent siderophore receptor [Glaciimonas immobilis]MBB5200401.1 catecholate siderophore receptor [Glaciimonas immobilis]